MKKFIVILLSLFVLIQSCKKDSAVNPYDDPALKAPNKTVTDPSYDPNGFTYIYKNVFKPTCANSGCHDGSFEPDFRTINSAYNTLVYQPVISNDASKTFTYRVVPGNVSLSLLHKRLIQDPFGLIGQGRMPWNNPNWNTVPANAQYIQNIVNWINAGAKDMMGVAPTIGNNNPRTIGVQIFPAGNTTSPYSRIKDDPINVPANTTVDIWTSIQDDVTLPQNMVVTEIKLSTKPYDFVNIATQSLVYSTPFSGKDFWGGPVSFTHKLASFSTTYSPGTILYIRTYTKDTDHTDVCEMPNDGTNEGVFRYFTIKII